MSSREEKKVKSKKTIKDEHIDEKDIDEKENDEELYHETPIMNLDEKNRIYSQIYVITCTETNKQYVGQANSHRKNKSKYRFHGYLGRFNDHISEAITNSRTIGGSRYLNNAIRKYGKEKFEVVLIRNCPIIDADTLEQQYIKEYDSLSPNGYNLALGGKSTKGWVSPIVTIDDEGLRIPNKRGREFGFKHKASTLQKMRDYFTTVSEEESQKKKETMRNSITEYNRERRAEILSKIDVIFEEDFEKYIRPVKKDGELVNYVIRIKRNRYSNLSNKTMSLDDRYEMLRAALEKAREIQQDRLKEAEQCDDEE